MNSQSRIEMARKCGSPLSPQCHSLGLRCHSFGPFEKASNPRMLPWPFLKFDALRI